MAYFIGLDVSLKRTAVCVLNDTGNIVLERSVLSDPGDIGNCLSKIPGEIERVGLEAGPLAPWLYSGLADARFDGSWAVIPIQSGQ